MLDERGIKNDLEGWHCGPTEAPSQNVPEEAEENQEKHHFE
jgi:hypothetical protein